MNDFSIVAEVETKKLLFLQLKMMDQKYFKHVLIALYLKNLITLKIVILFMTITKK